MTVSLKILLVAFFSLSTSIAEANVHRRSVGPVILDLGSLPQAQRPPGAPRPSAGRDDVRPIPQAEKPPEISKGREEPIVVTSSYPAHTQPLGALVLTANAQIEQAEESQPSILFTPSAITVPGLIAYYNPTFAADSVLFNRPVETLTTPADSSAGPATEIRAEASAAPPLTRLRAVVMWIGRFLFLVGVGALVQIFRRRRARPDDQASSIVPTDSEPPSGSASDVDLSLAPWIRGQGAASGAESLFLMRGKPIAIDKPESESKDFGLIEPGGAQPARTRREALSGPERQGRRSP